MTADRIGIALKGRRNGAGWLVCCPVIGHGKGRGDHSPSLSVADGDDNRLLLRCFAGCEFIDVLVALRGAGLVEDGPKLDCARPALGRVDLIPVEHAPDPEALKIWIAARPIQYTPAAEYLERRGIALQPPSLRCGTRGPTMVAAVQRPDGKIIAVQSLLLTREGQKASASFPRINTGALGAGAVRLAAAAEVMGIAEGVETALSAQTMAEIPVWASLGCHRMHRVELPEIVREVHIFGDNDASGCAAAQRAAEVHMALGRRVVLRFPPDGIKDFNDLLNADADEALRDQRLESPKGSVAA